MAILNFIQSNVFSAASHERSIGFITEPNVRHIKITQLPSIDIHSLFLEHGLEIIDENYIPSLKVLSCNTEEILIVRLFVKSDRVQLLNRWLEREYQFSVLYIPNCEFVILALTLRRSRNESSRCSKSVVSIYMKMLDCSCWMVKEKPLFLTCMLISKKHIG